MATDRRLPEGNGLLIDREQPVQFEFDGTALSAFKGDTIASALTAADQWVISRSFKYHRPRGVLTMAGQDANSLVQLPGAPNTQADRELVRPGMKVRAQNVLGSLRFDLAAAVGWLAPLLPVGFYYKAFFRPRGAWDWWARLFRRLAGLGVIDVAAPTARFDKQYLFCDVLVVGGGPAGLTAALAAAAAGHMVLLVDEQVCLGGALNYERGDVAGGAAQAEAHRLRTAIDSARGIRVLTQATANGWFADNWVPVIQHQRMFKVRASRVLLCTGATEQLAVFRNNDLPGILFASAAQRLLRLYGVRPGRRAVILTANDTGYATALDLLEAGVEVAALVDLRSHVTATDFTTAVAAQGVEILPGHAVFEARAARGGKHLQGVAVHRITSPGECAPDGRTIDCDVLCVAVGFMPMYQLACQAGATLNYNDSTANFEIVDLPHELRLAGAVNGCWSAADAAVDGAAAAIGRQTPATAVGSPNAHWPIFAHPRGGEFVDLDEDLQIADILGAVDEGYTHVQLVKRYSTAGMGPSQGRHSALPMARLVARRTGRTVAATGVTTARPPFAAELLGHAAGRSFYPVRRSNMHQLHAALGAQWLPAGAWLRPAYYGPPQAREEAIEREARSVRKTLGLIDVSTLGGLELRGPDAAELLNRLYTGLFSTLRTGRARYALLTNAAGVVIDDGVACRLHESQFYVTTTTTGADVVYRMMLQWQAQWRLDVDITNVSTALAAVNLAGPRARALLAGLCDVGLDDTEFPYMAVRAGRVLGIPARILRVGFVGELGYEIHVPQHSGAALWDGLLAAGASYGITPFGVEAQRRLRLEKGHVIVGQDTDAMSTPDELAMGWAIARRKQFFVGKRSLDVLRAQPLRRVLAGFCYSPQTDTQAQPLVAENQLVIDGGAMVGRVTSAARSTTGDQVVGLAYLPPELAVPGSRICIRAERGVEVLADVVELPFYDPDNSRQRPAAAVRPVVAPGAAATAIAQRTRTQPLRCSALAQWHAAHGATSFGALGVSDYGDVEAETTAVATLALCDLSLLPRIGFKGSAAPTWLAAELTLPSVPNAACCTGRALVARLSAEEFLLLDDWQHGGVVSRVQAAHVRQSTQSALSIYDLPRGDSHCCFLLSGSAAATTLAFVCAIDFDAARFDPGQVAQTVVGRVNAVVVRWPAAVPAFALLADASYALYLWEVLTDAIAAEGGRAVGVAALRAALEPGAGV